MAMIFEGVQKVIARPAISVFREDSVNLSMSCDVVSSSIRKDPSKTLHTVEEYGLKLFE
jgi:hypothetical protein